jgi:hypothetical protein
MGEVRIASEGTLWAVQASGSGNTFVTASAPASALIAYVTDFTYNSAQTVVQIMERGVPSHNKITQKQGIPVTFNALWTGAFPTAGSGGGATVPMWHLEHRASAAEIGDGSTGAYNLFIGAALQSVQFTERAEGDQLALSFMALGCVLNTGSGYIK